MHLYRRLLAKRVIYIYILVVICLFVVHFKLSQDYISPNALFTYCNKCLYNIDVGDEHDGKLDAFNISNSQASMASDTSDRLIHSPTQAENADNGFINTSTKDTIGIQKQDKHSNVKIGKEEKNFKRLDNKDREHNSTNVQEGREDFSVSSKNMILQQSEKEEIQLFHEKTQRLPPGKTLHAVEPSQNAVYEALDQKGVRRHQRGIPDSDVPSGKSTRQEIYSPPANEKPIKRFPQCIIIGFAKCGTRALLEYLGLHPYIVYHRAEMHFYDREEQFEKGFEWYKEQMPRSYSNQITMEKTPAYIKCQRARDEIHRLTPNAKFIILVRDPVIRLVSQFLLRYRNELPYHDVPVQVIYRDRITGQFDPEYTPVVTGIYHTHFAMWLERFPREQFLILNGEHLSENPLPVLKQVEKFLGIPPMFEERNFYFNESSGFFCPRGFEKNAIPVCLGQLKGVKHPKLPVDDEKMLYDFYQPLNEKFFQLAGKRFEWKEREWERYQ